MGKAIIWGLIVGLFALIINILTPGCFEPLIDFVVVAITSIGVVRSVNPLNRRAALGLGLVSAATAGLIITFGDLILTGLLAFGYLYKDQIPWLTLPDYSFLSAIFGNTLLLILVVFLCMGVVKITAILIGGLSGGLFFSPPRENN